MLAGLQNQLLVATHFAELGTVNSRGRLKLVCAMRKNVREDGDGGGAPSAELHICTTTATQGRHNILPLSKQIQKDCYHQGWDHGGGLDGILILRIWFCRFDINAPRTSYSKRETRRQSHALTLHAHMEHLANRIARGAGSYSELGKARYCVLWERSIPSRVATVLTPSPCAMVRNTVRAPEHGPLKPDCRDLVHDSDSLCSFQPG